ncbi:MULTISPECIES: winged helix-turn-helix domain-containing protein [unclassified Blastococcus]
MGDAGSPPWTFLTNHGHVLLTVALDPDARVTEIAERVGITPRAALAVLRDLAEAGYVTRTRRGRRTHYEVQRHRPFRHPGEAHREVDELLAIFTRPDPGPRREDGGHGRPVRG